MMKLLDISKKYGDTTHKYPLNPTKFLRIFEENLRILLIYVLGVRHVALRVHPMPSRCNLMRIKVN